MPRGVKARKNSNSIYIEFVFHGVRCREYFNMPPTKANIKWATDKRNAVLAKIRDKAFNYADEFPDSKKATQFGHIKSTFTIGEMLDSYLKESKKTLEPSTYRGYCIVVRTQLKRNFGNIRLKDLTPKHIREYIKNSPHSKKYITNALIPLRHILDEAATDKIIKESPMKPIVIAKHIDRDKANVAKKDDINPYDSEERKKLVDTAKGQLKNFIVTALYTGLRNPSEMIGLEWDHIDFENGVIKVQQARVLRKVKGTKTEAGNRDVPMLPQVKAALERQKEYTLLRHKFVFQHPASHKLLESYSLVRLWKTLHRKANVKWRPPKQTRHTFASMMCMAGENLWWLAKIMGHEDPTMILRNYSRFINDKTHIQGYKSKSDWSKLT